MKTQPLLQVSKNGACPLPRGGRCWRMLSALVLVAAFAAVSVSWNPVLVSADSDHPVITFTKWIIAPQPPTGDNMPGIVGGAVGAGPFVGKIESISTVGQVTMIDARYVIHGSLHSFTAENEVTQNNVTGRAVITGIVTEGWLRGARVKGEYTVMPTCPIPTPGNVLGTVCFQGTLQLLGGSKRQSPGE